MSVAKTEFENERYVDALGQQYPTDQEAQKSNDLIVAYQDCWPKFARVAFEKALRKPTKAFQILTQGQLQEPVNPSKSWSQVLLALSATQKN